MVKFFHLLTILSWVSELSVYGNSDRIFLMLTNFLCSAQCKQAVGSSVNCLFSLLPWRGHTPQRPELAYTVCHRDMNVLLGWPEGDRVCSGLTFFSSSFSSPMLCFPSGLAILLERFVMAALHPVGNMWYYPFGCWFDPSSERKRVQNWSLAPHGPMVGPGAQCQRSLWMNVQPPKTLGSGVLDGVIHESGL